MMTGGSFSEGTDLFVANLLTCKKPFSYYYYCYARISDKYSFR